MLQNFWNSYFPRYLKEAADAQMPLSHNGLNDWQLYRLSVLKNFINTTVQETKASAMESLISKSIKIGNFASEYSQRYEKSTLSIVSKFLGTVF